MHLVLTLAFTDRYLYLYISTSYDQAPAFARMYLTIFRAQEKFGT